MSLVLELKRPSGHDTSMFKNNYVLLCLVVLFSFNYIRLDPPSCVTPHLKEYGHGSNDASFLDGGAEAVKVVGIVKVDLHLGWETEHT